MAGIVQQRRDCRNAATADVHTKKRGREGDPGHVNCQREETFAIPGYGLRVGAGPPLRTARRILVIRQVVRAAEKRADEAGALRGPPHVAHPRMPAVHHLPAHEIHQHRSDLDGGVQRSVAGERPH
jgi:hypothetical protein